VRDKPIATIPTRSGSLKRVTFFIKEGSTGHFKAEEDLMSKHNYAGYPAQKAEHMQFIKDFSGLKSEFEKRESPHTS